MRKIIVCLICLFVFCFCDTGDVLSEGKSMKQKRPNRLRNICFIPYQNLIVGAWSSGTAGNIRFWAIDDGKAKDVLDLGKGEWASSLAVSNNGKLLVAALLDKTEVACFSLSERKWLWKVKWLDKGVTFNTMRFTPDDKKVVVVGFRNIATYDAKTGAILQRQEDSNGFSSGFPNYRTRINAISPSARYAAFWQGNLEHDETWWSSRNIWVNVRDIDSAKVIARQGKIQEKYKNCSAVFSPDEENLVLGSMDGFVRVWSLADQKVQRQWKAYSLEKPVAFDKSPAPNAIASIILSPDGRYLATFGDLKGRSTIRIWDYSSNKMIHEFDDVISSSLPMCSGYPMSFSPDGQYFAFEQQGQLCLYDTQSWKEIWSVPSWPEDKKE